MFDDMSIDEVIWDEELQHMFDQHGLLKLLAQGGEGYVGENEFMVKGPMDEPTLNTGAPMLLEFGMASVDAVYDEMPAGIGSHHGLLQQLAHNGDHFVEKRKLISTEPVVDDLITCVNGPISVLELSVDSMHDVFAERHLENKAAVLTKQVEFMDPVSSKGASHMMLDEIQNMPVVWDDELLHGLGSHEGLLQKLTGGGEFLHDAERKLLNDEMLVYDGGLASAINPGTAHHEFEKMLGLDVVNVDFGMVLPSRGCVVDHLSTEYINHHCGALYIIGEKPPRRPNTPSPGNCDMHVALSVSNQMYSWSRSGFSPWKSWKLCDHLVFIMMFPQHHYRFNPWSGVHRVLMTSTVEITQGIEEQMLEHMQCQLVDFKAPVLFECDALKQVTRFGEYLVDGDIKPMADAAMDQEHITIDRDTPFLLVLCMDPVDVIPTNFGVYEDLTPPIGTYDSLLQQLAFGKAYLSDDKALTHVGGLPFFLELDAFSAGNMFEGMLTKAIDMDISVGLYQLYQLSTKGAQLEGSSIPLSPVNKWSDSGGDFDAVELHMTRAQVCQVEASLIDEGNMKYDLGAAGSTHQLPAWSHGISSSRKIEQRAQDYKYRVGVDFVEHHIALRPLEKASMLQIQQHLPANGTERTIVLTVIRLSWAFYVISWCTVLEDRAFKCQNLCELYKFKQDEISHGEDILQASVLNLLLTWMVWRCISQSDANCAADPVLEDTIFEVLIIGNLCAGNRCISQDLSLQQLAWALETENMLEEILGKRSKLESVESSGATLAQVR